MLLPVRQLLFLGPFLFGILVYNFSPQSGLLAVLGLFIIGYIVFQTVFKDKVNLNSILSFSILVLIILFELVYILSPKISSIF